MPRIVAFPWGMSDKVSLDAAGTFGFPKRVMERVKWRVPGNIKVDYLMDEEQPDAPVVVFLSSVGAENNDGYTLSYLNRSRNGGSGGKMKCQHLIRTVIAPRVVLPISDLTPIYPPNGLADLVLMLTSPIWSPVEFTMAGVQSIPNDLVGVYQIPGDGDKPIKIGQGLVAARLREHLREERLTRAARAAEYFPVTLKSDAVLYEKVMIAQHENVYDALPEMNRIRA